MYLYGQGTDQSVEDCTLKGAIEPDLKEAP